MERRHSPVSNRNQSVWSAVLLFGLLFAIDGSNRAEAAGGIFSCALTAAGGVKCWGNNQLGQLGVGYFTPQSPYGGIASPVDVTGLTSGVVQVTVGSAACALTTAGGVKCWGPNFGQLPPTGVASPIDVPGLTSGVIQISAGAGHVCVLTTDGGVKCWGDNRHGQLGIGTFGEFSETPVDVHTLAAGVTQISAGGAHTCALTTAGAVKCWGDNIVGELGNGTFNPSDPTGIATPVDVTGLTSGVAQISAGGFHTCALTAAEGVKCWGWNSYGQLGLGAFTEFSATPVDVETLAGGVQQISSGQVHTCAVTNEGIAKCWGRNFAGQLGDGESTNSPTPVDVSGLTSGVVQISSGFDHTCAVSTTAGAKCWGGNHYGELGNGEFTTDFPYGITTPVDVIGLTSGVAALWDAEPITPMVPWTFSGFYHPVEMGGALNTVKGGSTVPIKFQVFAGASELTDPSIVVQPLTATQAACSGGPPDTIELTATGGTNLRYAGGRFIFNWKTPKMPGYCYTVTVALTGGGSLSANFELR